MRRTDINNKNVVNDLIDPVKRTADIFARMDTDKDGLEIKFNIVYYFNNIYF